MCSLSVSLGTGIPSLFSRPRGWESQSQSQRQLQLSPSYLLHSNGAFLKAPRGHTDTILRCSAGQAADGHFHSDDQPSPSQVSLLLYLLNSNVQPPHLSFFSFNLIHLWPYSYELHFGLDHSLWLAY